MTKDLNCILYLTDNIHYYIIISRFSTKEIVFENDPFRTIFTLTFIRDNHSNK